MTAARTKVNREGGTVCGGSVNAEITRKKKWWASSFIGMWRLSTRHFGEHKRTMQFLFLTDILLHRQGADLSQCRGGQMTVSSNSEVGPTVITGPCVHINHNTMNLRSTLRKRVCSSSTHLFSHAFSYPTCFIRSKKREEKLCQLICRGSVVLKKPPKKLSQAMPNWLPRKCVGW